MSSVEHSCYHNNSSYQEVRYRLELYFGPKAIHAAENRINKKAAEMQIQSGNKSSVSELLLTMAAQ